MAIPIVIGCLYLVSAALLWRAEALPLAVTAAILSPVALGLTLYLRGLAAKVAAKAYLREQAEAGLSHQEAVEAFKDREEGVTIDTDDVPQWPFTTMLIVSAGSLAMLVYALLR